MGSMSLVHYCLIDSAVFSRDGAIQYLSKVNSAHYDSFFGIAVGYSNLCSEAFNSLLLQS